MYLLTAQKDNSAGEHNILPQRLLHVILSFFLGGANAGAGVPSVSPSGCTLCAAVRRAAGDPVVVAVATPATPVAWASLEETFP